MANPRLKPIIVAPSATLQGIAMRELGDGLRWRELVTLNRLVPPYIVPTHDASKRLPHTLIWGDTLYIPSNVTSASAVLGEDALGVDVLLDRGMLQVTGTGDINTIVGVENFVQALRHRIYTTTGTYLPHPTYGSHIRNFLGLGNNPGRRMIAVTLATMAMKEDPRTRDTQLYAQIEGDTLFIGGRVLPTKSDTPGDMNAVFTLPRT